MEVVSKQSIKQKQEAQIAQPVKILNLHGNLEGMIVQFNQMIYFISILARYAIRLLWKKISNVFFRRVYSYL